MARFRLQFSGMLRLCGLVDTYQSFGGTCNPCPQYPKIQAADL
jgi:hypothetical protein